ncbi:60s acidic ribosomal protein domain-containing protein [Ditylenchus destructor]|uniref:Large ribosomal subunit protein P2 n=1 Tax=Ditylenchus destructor TaxID=166010 RepID=A0AAD4N4K3_9BILA|nr:60s acidic ribosomal protein domain-containing protein [Ditylenchus destructor]
MKYVAAYLLANLGGNASPTAKDLEKILGAASLDVDMENANAVVNALKGKEVGDVIAAGQKKLASYCYTVNVSAFARAKGTHMFSPKKEEKKEESEDEDMGFGLFD